MIKPKAITCDLDSTLCMTHMRKTAFDGANTDWVAYSKACKDDPVIEGTKRLLHILQKHYTIILISGRDYAAIKETIAWLDQHEIDYEDILLDDNTVVESHPEYKVRRIREVAANYDVMMHLDDWAGVKARVEAELGIPVLLVNPAYDLQEVIENT